jgi:hypothetical protein
VISPVLGTFPIERSVRLLCVINHTRFSVVVFQKLDDEGPDLSLNLTLAQLAGVLAKLRVGRDEIVQIFQEFLGLLALSCYAHFAHFNFSLAG